MQTQIYKNRRTVLEQQAKNSWWDKRGGWGHGDFKEDFLAQNIDLHTASRS